MDFEPRVLGSRAESVSIVGCALEGDDEDMVFHLGLGWGGLTARQINNVSTHGEHTISANLDGHRMEPRPGLYDYTARGAVTNYSPSEGRLVAHGLIKSHPVFKPGELWFEVDIKWNPNDFPDPSGSGGGGDGGGASSGKGGAAGAGGEAGASGSSGFAGIGGLAGEGGQ